MPDSFVELRTIKNIDKLIDTGNENAILSMAIAGTAQAKLFAPVNKQVGIGGQLRNSIQYITGTGKKDGLNDSGGDKATGQLTESLRRYEAAIGATAEYATYVEYGTRFMAPQVYLRSSMAILAGDSVDLIRNKMNQEFAKGALKYGQSRVKF